MEEFNQWQDERDELPEIQLRPNSTVTGNVGIGVAEPSKIRDAMNLDYVFKSLLERWGIPDDHPLKKKNVNNIESLLLGIDRAYDFKINKGFEKVSAKIDKESQMLMGRLTTLSSDLLTYQTSVSNSMAQIKSGTVEKVKPVTLSTSNVDKDYTKLYRNLALLIPGKTPGTSHLGKAVKAIAASPDQRVKIINWMNETDSLDLPKYTEKTTEIYKTIIA